MDRIFRMELAEKNLAGKTKREQKSRFLLLTLSLALALGLLQCGTRRPASPPDWLKAEAPKADDKFYYGTGCAQPEITNRFFQKDTAEERARVDLANNLWPPLVKELNGDTIAAREVVISTLTSRKIVGTYRDDKGRFCARAALEKRLVEEAVEKIKKK